MKLIIDITEETYQATCDGSMLPPDVKNVVNAIKNSVQIPKGHGKLYEENEIKNEAVRREWTSSMYYALDHMLSYMKPIVEADKGDEGCK